MKHNVGGIDRTLRATIGIVALTAGAYFNNSWGLLGLIPLATSVVSWCPLYRVLGISTSRSVASPAGACCAHDGRKDLKAGA